MSDENPTEGNTITTENTLDELETPRVLGQNIANTFKNTFIQSEQSFQTKLQEKYAKKLQTRLSESSNQLTPEESRKKANQELLEGLSSDIREVVRENIRQNMNEQINMFSDDQGSNRLPAGIPKTFLIHQNKIGAIEPQKAFPNNPPVSRWDRKTPLEQPVPGYEAQNMSVKTAKADKGQRQVYSPTNNEDREGSESPDMLEQGQKRLSAFERLGPLAQPKKPKLTINLSLSKDQDVREVVEIKKDVPVHDNEEIVNSTDETVIKFLPVWPWKQQVVAKKTVTVRTSKTVMMMEQEQMEEIYATEKDNAYFMIAVKGYPPSWAKEDVLDTMLDNLKGKSFVPLFIEFNSKECKFFVIRCRGALLTIHWLGFVMRKDDVELKISISLSNISIKKLDFNPRAVIKRRIAMNYDGERVLDLSEFTLKYDISHFIYFPLNRSWNQDEIVRIQSDVVWEYLTELNLSHNKITSLEGFNLELTTPRLRTLDLSHNCIENIKPLLQCRQLPLKRLHLEGNPLCTDYTDPERYVTVMKTIYPTLRELDDIPIVLKGEMPNFQRNYCPPDAMVVVEKFLEIFFPLLELPREDRADIQSMYSDKAVMTITYRNRMRHDPTFKDARNLLIKSRVLLEGDCDEVHGASSIVKLLKKWPNIQHDPATFTVDVMFHSESSTVVRINGILKLTAESLAEDETLLAFTRTIHLHTKNGSEYKIYNEMLYWDKPTHEFSKRAFQMLSVPKKNVLDIKFESPPDDDTKERLVEIFMKITELEKLPSERCLEAKDWHMKHALEYFMKLLKLDNLQKIMT
ncbi:nuclear RNA export factor 1-like isoform X2 [Maniola jurtina]|uniref:nuclear RNA export factor 1-like isoform X2 n=1 Tax=Maniola jurtina TaxID=191418 RepID=UPI001E685E57|nr:nuclear RNA export factor 1-like isoform X2 [Maniola jurtina]